MKIDREEARRIAELAHLQLDDSALDRMAGEMTTILGYIEMLPSVESAGDDSGTTPLRDDVTRPSVDREKIARNAPEWEGGFFIVPPVIE
ncbi:MAG TPA: Asp-tRNA(Asn)/Glu-tRNA(Gln) amidotransferase subunit GatC [Thermoanaerobaculia bacterium]|nr:Asp-tRNA(Asn)/Glu-tRNA(Gln) amidotransferase subunit GatC [Thermoanaerobaculia bacterium]